MSEQPSNLQILLRRAIKGEEYGAFTDGYNLRLVFEGGGTAPGGAGAALGLQDGIHYAVELTKNGGDREKADASLKEYQAKCFKTGQDQCGVNVFDHVDGALGSSAGVWTMSFLRAGQCHKGVTIFHKYLTDPKFMEHNRFIKYAFVSVANEIFGSGNSLNSAMDLNYLTDIIKGKCDPALRLDTEKITKSKTPLSFLALDVNTKKTVELKGFKNFEEVIEAGLAACLVPGIAGKPDPKKRRLVDAGRFGQNNGIGIIPGNENERFIVFTPRALGAGGGHTRFDKIQDDFLIECASFVAESFEEGRELVSFARKQRRIEAIRIAKSHKNDLHTYLGPTPGSLQIPFSCQDATALLESERSSYVYARTCLREAMIKEGLLPVEAANDPILLPLSLSPLCGVQASRARGISARKPYKRATKKEDFWVKHSLVMSGLPLCGRTRNLIGFSGNTAARYSESGSVIASFIKFRNKRFLQKRSMGAFVRVEPVSAKAAARLKMTTY